MKKIIAFVVLFILLCSCQQAENNEFEKVRVALNENYLALNGESCGDATQLFANRISDLGMTYRTLQFFSDPGQTYDTHVAAEVKIDGNWVYVDPTFNGFYKDKASDKYLSAEDIRKKVLEGNVSDLVFVVNGEIRDMYNISKYYVNPLYTFKGMIYNEYGVYTYISDKYTPEFKQEFSVFRDYPPIKVANVEAPTADAKWGLIGGYVNGRKVNGWRRDEDNAINIDVQKGKKYALKTKFSSEDAINIILESGNIRYERVIESDDTIIEYTSISANTGEDTLRFSAESESLVKKEHLHIYEIYNDFKDKVTITSL